MNEHELWTEHTLLDKDHIQHHPNPSPELCLMAVQLSPSTLRFIAQQALRWRQYRARLSLQHSNSSSTTTRPA